MATLTRLQTIDSDAHVVESERTWDYLEPSEEKYRPRMFSTPDDDTKRYWVVEDKIAGLRLPNLSDYQLQALSEIAGRNVVTPQAAREMDDVGLRLKHMDELGIDIQVLHNTLWIEQVTTKPAADVALCGSWNRWLAHIWKEGQGRLRWSCLVPTTSMPDAADQMRFAKENGAVAVCMRPIEGNRSFTDPYFYPIYEEAAKLDMAVAIHIANGNPANCELHRSFPEGLTARSFAMFRGPTVVACHTLLLSRMHQDFPTLRWGFIEASCEWIPWIYREASRRFAGEGREFPVDAFREFGIFVTCQTDEDLPWVLRYAGEHSLVIGTDYGHFDPSSEVDAISIFRQNQDISEESKERILHHNPKALYNL